MKRSRLMKMLATNMFALLILAAGSSVHAGVFTVDLVNNPVNGDGAVIFESTTYGTSGTGVTDPFLAVGGANAKTVWGYNNNAAAPESPFVDTSKTGPFTLADVPVVSIGDTPYREFLLDNNQQSGGLDKSVIRLTQLEIYTVDSDPGINLLATLRAAGSLAYSLDTPGRDGTVEINADPSGSAKADMFLYVPDFSFTTFGSEAATNVYLFCEFEDNNDGFEEWAVLMPGHVNDNLPVPSGGGPIGERREAPAVPEPSILSIAGTLLLGLRRRRRS
jgi:hypothetical protein